MNDDLDAMLFQLAPQDVDRFRTERTRALSREELRGAVNLRSRKLRAFEPLLVAVACVVYLSWAFMRAMSALGG
jgi:hypothetical protein